MIYSLFIFYIMYYQSNWGGRTHRFKIILHSFVNLKKNVVLIVVNVIILCPYSIACKGRGGGLAFYSLSNARPFLLSFALKRAGRIIVSIASILHRSCDKIRIK